MTRISILTPDDMNDEQRAVIDASKADATVGEMMETMKGVFGSYNGGPEW